MGIDANFIREVCSQMTHAADQEKAKEVANGIINVINASKADNATQLFALSIVVGDVAHQSGQHPDHPSAEDIVAVVATVAHDWIRFSDEKDAEEANAAG